MLLEVTSTLSRQVLLAVVIHARRRHPDVLSGRVEASHRNGMGLFLSQTCLDEFAIRQREAVCKKTRSAEYVGEVDH